MKDKQSIIEILRQGQQSEFWAILCEQIRRKIAEINEKENRDHLKNLPADQYKLENELRFAKIEFLEGLQVLPEDTIATLIMPVTEDRDFDPYRKPGEFEN